MAREAFIKLGEALKNLQAIPAEEAVFDLSVEEVLIAARSVAINKELEEIHNEIAQEFKEKKTVAIDQVSYEKRQVRLARSWVLFNRLDKLKNELPESSDLTGFIERLSIEAKRISKESFLYLTKSNEVIVVPFSQLNTFSKPGGTINHVALHPDIYLPDGISLSEVQNASGSEQRWHDHKGTETTISLSNGVIVEACSSSGKIKETVNFGSMIRVPSEVFHRISNSNNDIPSADFTVKDPVLQLQKGFTLNNITSTQKVEVVLPMVDSSDWGSVFTHFYPGMHKKLELNEKGHVAFDENNSPRGVDKTYIRARVITLNPGKSSDPVGFDPIYPGFQVIHILPWPQAIPKGWNMEKAKEELKGVVRILCADGTIVERKFRGGDHLVLNGLKAKKFEIQNTSDRHILVFAVIDMMPAIEQLFERTYAQWIDGFVDDSQGKNLGNLKKSIEEVANKMVLNSEGELIRGRHGISLVSFFEKGKQQFAEEDSNMDTVLGDIRTELRGMAIASERKNLHMTISAPKHPGKERTSMEIAPRERYEITSQITKKIKEIKKQGIGPIKIKFKGISVTHSGMICMNGYPEIDGDQNLDKINILRRALGVTLSGKNIIIPSFYVSIATFFNNERINIEKINRLVEKYKDVTFGTLMFDELTLFQHEDDLLINGEVLMRTTLSNVSAIAVTENKGGAFDKRTMRKQECLDQSI
jgi:hypothetical protein